MQVETTIEHPQVSLLRARLRTLMGEDCDDAIQVAAFVDGKPVFTVAEGNATPGGAGIGNDSLFTVFSVSKALTTMIALSALGESDLDLDRPVAHVWPQMKVAGMERITLRHCLTHRAGLPFMPSGTTVEQMCDWDHMCSALASQELAWEPGTASGYHAYTFGWLVGEVSRRILGTDRSVGDLLRQRLCDPAGVDEIWFGLPQSEHGRVARVLRSYGPLPAALPVQRAMPNDLTPGDTVYGRADVRSAILPGAGAIASARGLAKLFSALVASSGQRLIQASLLEQSRRADFDGLDCISAKPSVRGLGFYVGGHANALQAAPFGPDASTFGHSGAGGHLAWADRRRGAGFAVLRNRMYPDGFAAENVTKSVQWTLEAFDAVTANG